MSAAPPASIGTFILSTTCFDPFREPDAPLLDAAFAGLLAFGLLDEVEPERAWDLLEPRFAVALCLV
jgi:hypothetical protein